MINYMAPIENELSICINEHPFTAANGGFTGIYVGGISVSLKISKQTQLEVDQTSASASKPGPSNQAVILDPPHPRPRPTSHPVENMEVEYGPSLPPHRSAGHYASDQHSGLSDEPSKVASARSKKHSHSHKSMTLNRGLPRINIQFNPMNLGLHLLDLKICR